jgi:hypothetical protein
MAGQAADGGVLFRLDVDAGTPVRLDSANRPGGHVDVRRPDDDIGVRRDRTPIKTEPVGASRVDGAVAPAPQVRRERTGRRLDVSARACSRGPRGLLRTAPETETQAGGQRAVLRQTRLVEMMPPDTNRGPSVPGQPIPLEGRKAVVPTCREEVLAALAALEQRCARQVFTVGEIYAQMVSAGTPYAEGTVFKTMQRTKAPAARPPYGRLARVGRDGFRLLVVDESHRRRARRPPTHVARTVGCCHRDGPSY